MFRLRLFHILLITLLAGHTASALEVREKRWGFDGRVRPGRFNILSVLVVNPDARAFDGQLVMEEHRGMQKPVGAPVVQPVYLAAGSSRWVQLHLFINQPGEEWRLRWGNGARENETIDGAQFAAPARVLLIDPESAFAAKSAMRAFPDDLFPSTVAATDALDSVVLDHVPRWEPARREAFLDWLRAGGTLHLLHGADGEFPKFPETLAPLNAGAERTAIGAGLIVRHPIARGEMSEQYLTDHGFPAPELKTTTKVLIYNFETQLLQKLASLTKPAIAWWLINVLTVGYIAVVGPLHYRWSKRLPWLRSIVLLVLLVAGFGAAFAYVGRRGANEKQQTRVLAIAHSLGDGRYDVTEWMSVFVTRGATYKLTHASSANLYSTATEFDSVNGTVVNERDGHFDVDIPLFSTRPFLHRAVLTGDRTDVTVADWQTFDAGRLKSLALVPGAGFPRDIAHIWVQQGDNFHALKRDGERWVLDGEGKSVGEFLPDNYFHFHSSNTNFSGSPMLFGGDGEEKPGDKWIENTGPLLIARALGDIEGLANLVTRPQLPSNRLRLFIFAALPDGFRIQDPRFKSQQGRVLYWEDVTKP